MGFPSTPKTTAPYAGGTITLTQNAVSNLWELIKAQISSTCPGTAHITQIEGDPANDGSATVKFGPAKNDRGALSDTEYAWSLPPTGSRFYQASILGANAPISRVFVFTSAASQKIHVEVVA